MSSLPALAPALNVATGGAIGALLRYQGGRWMTGWLGAPAMGVFPWATLAVNALGGLLMGILAGYLFRMAPADADPWRLFLGTGILGGFTTFSAFSLELMVLIERGQPATALGYALVSVLAGLIGLYVGLIVMRLAAA